MGLPLPRRSPNEVIEIRQVQEIADFPEDVQKAASGFRGDEGAGGAGTDLSQSERAGK